MAIDQRQIADIENIVPEYVMDTLQSGSTVSFDVQLKSDSKYHMRMILPKHIIEGASSETNS